MKYIITFLIGAVCGIALYVTKFAEENTPAPEASGDRPARQVRAPCVTPTTLHINANITAEDIEAYKKVIFAKIDAAVSSFAKRKPDADGKVMPINLMSMIGNELTVDENTTAEDIDAYKKDVFENLDALVYNHAKRKTGSVCKKEQTRVMFFSSNRPFSEVNYSISFSKEKPREFNWYGFGLNKDYGPTAMLFRSKKPKEYEVNAAGEIVDPKTGKKIPVTDPRNPHWERPADFEVPKVIPDRGSRRSSAADRAVEKRLKESRGGRESPVPQPQDAGAKEPAPAKAK